MEFCSPQRVARRVRALWSASLERRFVASIEAHPASPSSLAPAWGHVLAMPCPCTTMIGDVELAARAGLALEELRAQVRAAAIPPPIRIGNSDYWSLLAVSHLIGTGKPHHAPCGHGSSSTLRKEGADAHG